MAFRLRTLIGGGFAGLARRFASDAKANIAIIFALTSTVIVVSIGGGLDLSSAYFARQKLSEIATLTCQYSTRASVVSLANSTSGNSSGFQTYLSTVNAFAASNLNAQHWSAASPTGAGGGTYFTATAASGNNNSPSGTAPTNGFTDMSANIPTSFLKIIKVTQIPVHAHVGCQSAVGTPPATDNPYVLQTGFETSCVGYCDILPNGSNGTQPNPTLFPSTAGYTDPTGAQWYITGYCLEVDQVGVISATDPQGTHSAELDCDNGSSTAGNSSISSKVYLANGNYELRYNYRSRIDFPQYDPAYICGSTASDVSWATDPDTNGAMPGNVRGNEINVYLDLNTTGSAPLHTTLDGKMQLAGSNLIDMCVYSINWIQRSVKITVTTPGYYWLSFAADGTNSSYGGQLDNILFCKETCPSSFQDDFPPSWVAIPLLFVDSFTTVPPQVANTSYSTNTSGNLNTTLAGNVVSKSALQPGWPTQIVPGWGTAPTNQITYVTTGGSGLGGPYIELDNCATNCTNGNRLISRPFLLDPGYYQVGYNYMAMANFIGISGTYCFSAPANGFTWGSEPNVTAQIRYQPSTITVNALTNIVEVFMSHGQLASTPIASAATGLTTAYNNPNGSTSTTPTVAPDGISASSYNANQSNQLLDSCGYQPNYGWVPRAANIKISKPGFYWLTFSASVSTPDGAGAGLDNITLTALGSPYMANPPSTPIAIPVPSPQDDTNYSNSGAFNGFYIVADPFSPPAADQ